MLKKLKVAILIVLQCCIIVLAIKVPVTWSEGDHSEIEESNYKIKKDVGTLIPQNIPKKFVPVEYFEYTAKKPEFAVEIANYFGAPQPAQLYKSHPIKPFTILKPPQLGKHELLKENNKIFHPYQAYVLKTNGPAEKHVSPASSNYEVFHPYKQEEPGLKSIYKDPVLDKIRSDLQNTKNEHQNYIENSGNSDITKSEYLESPDETDLKKLPQRNIPAQFEIHKPQRHPAYYKVPFKLHNRDPILNKKFKHPLSQNYVKVRPVHYLPLKKHIQKLRQNHALKYDDEKNEYPQVLPLENLSQPQEGYDIYENAKLKYNNFRNNIDESINRAVIENKPHHYQNLEIQKDNSEDNDDEEDFVPVKNYAQVRKSEIIKHLPREAALEDAISYDEIKNAPRLREAVKQTKAQTVYTEEGYEDAAYDHAGEQKHASDNEGHGGYLKQYELSKGKFKTPQKNTQHENEEGAAYGDKVLHKERWKNIDEEDEIQSDDLSDIGNEGEFDVETFHNDSNDEETTLRNKREKEIKNESEEKFDKHNVTEHDVSKRAANFEVPTIDLSSTYLTEDEILKLAKRKLQSYKNHSKKKYPYYFEISKNINKHSPLRYAENLSNIPNKSMSNTAFYDSRSLFECEEVDEDVDPIPDKLKKDGHPDDISLEDENFEKKNEQEKEHDNIKKPPRLKGLGDKIDCFKTKYFGQNPLDSPFFNEELIVNPEPPNIPNSSVFKINPVVIHHSNLFINKRPENNSLNLFDTINELRKNGNISRRPEVNINGLNLLRDSNKSLKENSNEQQNTLLEDVFLNIKNNTQVLNTNVDDSIVASSPPSREIKNITSLSCTEKADIRNENISRKKRDTSFVYEPYKIIKEGQLKEIKKVQFNASASPLIKKLQSSKFADRVNKKSGEGDPNYRDHNNGRNNREKLSDKVKYESSIIDVNDDTRRGEPRYELKPTNHKSEYTPVENKKIMSIEDYESKLNLKNQQQKIESLPRKKIKTEEKQPVSFLPNSSDIQVTSASQNVRRMIKNRTEASKTDNHKKAPGKDKNTDIEEYYEEYDDYVEENMTTTTTKPIFKKRTTTSTEKPQEEPFKIRLVTRFRTSTTTERSESYKEIVNKLPLIEEENVDKSRPKYREKKKKSSKSTLVTDSQSYGDDSDENMKKTEVDALIGVKQNMEDYLPEYEKAAEKYNRATSPESVEAEDQSEEEEEEYDDDEIEDSDEEDTPTITTSEPTKRTLQKTSDAPISTTEIHDENLTPIIMKKQVEIHRELPGNASSPHQSLFQQKIHEIEVIKENPSKLVQNKTNKNLEALEIYKDDNLAKDVNKLRDVEIFKSSLDLKNAPRHGGNYKSATVKNRDKDQISDYHEGNLQAPTENVETSQTENKKHVKLEEMPTKRLHGGSLKSLNNFQRIKGSRGRNSKLVELSVSSEPIPSETHGGKFKSRDNDKGKSAKLIELDEYYEEEDKSNDGMHSGNFNRYGNSQSRKPLHGGNYRSAKIVQADDKEQTAAGENFKTSTNGRYSAAALLSGLAQAVPLLTTTPAYILDPSKRMYYYVDV